MSIGNLTLNSKHITNNYNTELHKIKVQPFFANCLTLYM